MIRAVKNWLRVYRSMAVGEFISVSSQKDSEMADIEKERVEQAKGASCVSVHILVPLSALVP